MENTIDFNEVQDRFDELLDRTENGESFIIEKDGIPMAAIISYGEYQKWVEIRPPKENS
ncbi:MAG: type II toxin-antitoxin system prevent-host-death family antitoxin [Rubrobacteridae bacterium]|nr:type II toxin-antitoxin system prevent-host-death family antitoxin [Rubrobacteridae bacterium]